MKPCIHYIAAVRPDGWPIDVRTAQMRALARALLVVLCVPFLAGAQGQGETAAAGEGGGGELTVFAAASLTEPFREIGRAFEAEGAGQVAFNFGGSNELRTQLENGAQADLLATASVEDMDKAKRAALIDGPPATFAHNRLVVLVPAESIRVHALADLAAPGTKIVVAHPNVPVGRYAQQMLARMGLSATYGAAFRERALANIASLETNVKQVVAKIALGEADAGVVYVSDVTPPVAGKTRRIDIPAEFNVDATYPIAVLARSQHKPLARRFLDWVRSPRGQAILSRHRFLTSPTH